jgi:hypothetical protein
MQACPNFQALHSSCIKVSLNVSLKRTYFAVFVQIQITQAWTVSTPNRQSKNLSGLTWCPAKLINFFEQWKKKHSFIVWIKILYLENHSGKQQKLVVHG